MSTDGSYTIGIICALALEARAVIAMLDSKHPSRDSERKDSNYYYYGSIGQHNVVIACLPAGSTGTINAAQVANNMRHSFDLRFALMVGIAGGVSAVKENIRLGDVVVGIPSGEHSGVIQWDFGKSLPGGFQRTGCLNAPPTVLLNAVQDLRIRQDDVILKKHIDLMSARLKKDGYVHQGHHKDELFKPDYNHIAGETCQQCDRQYLVAREARESDEPEIHYGNIASGNQVLKDGGKRDEIAKGLDALCFEMEAAGLGNDFPCLVIRGICDYADSHKHKQWQPYAAATAAAYAKELLLAIRELPPKAKVPDMTSADGRQTGSFHISGSKIGNLANTINAGTISNTF